MSAKEPYVSAKEPYESAKEPSNHPIAIHTQEIPPKGASQIPFCVYCNRCQRANNVRKRAVYIRKRAISICKRALHVSAKEPYVSAKEPYVSAKALHIHKRALHVRKSASCIHKRALKSPATHHCNTSSGHSYHPRTRCAPSCKSFFAKEPLIRWLFCGK